jgi:hypothetical protein
MGDIEREEGGGECIGWEGESMGEEEKRPKSDADCPNDRPMFGSPDELGDVRCSWGRIKV